METSKKAKKKTITDINQYADVGKIPPQAVELEEAVLGALMIDTEAMGLINEIIRSPEYFYSPKHRKIFSAIKTLSIESNPVDILTVQEQLKKDGTLQEVDGVPAISKLTANITSSAHIESHSKIIAQKFIARELIRISTEIINEAFEPSTDVKELMQEAEGKIFEISQTNHKKDVEHIGKIIPQAIFRIEEAMKNDTDITGEPSDFHALDKITSGWQKSDLIILAARPSMGKTAFVLTMAKNMATNGIPVAFFSLEMSNIQLVNRLIVNASELTGDKIKSGRLNKEEFNELSAGIGKLENIPLYIDDTPSLSVLELRTKARRLVAEHGIKMIIIDYLQLMNATGMGFFNREGEVSLISRNLKALAKELNIPIIALSQLNRNLETRGFGSKDDTGKLEAKKPQLSDLRESGAIEQDADIVCFVHRPEYFRIFEDPDTKIDLRGVAQIVIAKHRNGAIGDVNLFFAKDYAMFINERSEYERLRAKSVNAASRILGSKINKKHKDKATEDIDYSENYSDDNINEVPPF
ncbi:MAG: replicative DNA helicase [Prevotellaceae bacterium]|jgi:replicative DNA helicase|nr:replicative DNA helicase [Prevotellaceae bacterium]